MIATHIQIRHKTLGGDVHVRVFTGVPGFTFASVGELTFSVEEWPVMRELFGRAKVYEVAEFFLYELLRELNRPLVASRRVELIGRLAQAAQRAIEDEYAAIRQELDA